MYVKPKLERMGSFREITQSGLSGSSDGLLIGGTQSPPPDGGCTSGCPSSS